MQGQKLSNQKDNHRPGPVWVPNLKMCAQEPKPTAVSWTWRSPSIASDLQMRYLKSLEKKAALEGGLFYIGPCWGPSPPQIPPLKIYIMHQPATLLAHDGV